MVLKKLISSKLFMLILGFLGGVLILGVILISVNYKGTLKADTYDSANGNFVISTVADISNFAKDVNAGNYNCFEGITVTLGDNIDMGSTWTFIASNSTYPFKGTFDGNGFTISNVYYSGSSRYAAMFLYTNSATFRNLNISKVTMRSTYSGFRYIAGLIYSATGNTVIDSVNITDPYIYQSGSASKDYGGYTTGYVHTHTEGTITFNNCILSMSTSGGIGGGTRTVRACGFLGSTAGNLTFTNSKLYLNYSSIYARDSNNSSNPANSTYAAGVVSSVTGVLYVDNCELNIGSSGINSSTYSTRSSTANGWAAGLGCTLNNTANMIKNTTINISASVKSDGAGGYTGGVACIYSGTMENVTVNVRCTNGVYASAYYDAYAGGFVERSNSNNPITFNNCKLNVESTSGIYAYGSSTSSNYGEGISYAYGFTRASATCNNCIVTNDSGTLVEKMIYSRAFDTYAGGMCNGTINNSTVEKVSIRADCISNTNGIAYGFGSSAVTKNCVTDGCSIEGVYAYGMNGSSVDGGIVRNCTITGGVGYSISSSTYVDSGAYGICRSSASNCISENNIIKCYIAKSYNNDSGTSDAHAAGITAGSSSTITNCISSNNEIWAGYETSRAGRAYAGGIASHGITTTAPTISNCINTSNVTVEAHYSSSSATNIYAGGIAAYSSTIKNCLNKGNIRAWRDSTTTTLYGSVYAGGITSSGGTVTNCGNLGNITVEGASSGTIVACGGTNTFAKCTLTLNCTTNNISTSKATIYDLTENVAGVQTIDQSANYTSMKDEAYYRDISNWNASYPWNLDEIWGIYKFGNINDGYPVILLDKIKFVSANEGMNITAESEYSVTINVSNDLPVKIYTLYGEELMLVGNRSYSWEYGNFECTLLNNSLTINCMKYTSDSLLGKVFFFDSYEILSYINYIDDTVSINIKSQHTDGSAVVEISYLKPNTNIGFRFNGSEKYLIKYNKHEIVHINDTSYEYSFANGITTVVFSNLPADNNMLEIFEKPYSVNVICNEQEVSYTYYATGANLIIDAKPISGYFIDYVRINGEAPIVINTSYGFCEYGNGLGLFWVIREDNSVVFTFVDALDTVEFEIVSAQGEIIIGAPSTIDKIAVTTTVGGEARILEKDDNNFTVIAVAYTGYKFYGWTIDDGQSYLLDENGDKLTESANLSLDLFKGKLLKAVFILVDNGSTNPDLDDGIIE